VFLRTWFDDVTIHWTTSFTLSHGDESFGFDSTSVDVPLEWRRITGMLTIATTLIVLQPHEGSAYSGTDSH